MKTPLHTRPSTLDDYERVALDLLGSLAEDVKRLRASNRAGDSDQESRERELAERMETERWVDIMTQQVRDVVYLLAVGDNGPAAAHAADPDGASRQAHHDRMVRARERLNEDGLL